MTFHFGSGFLFDVCWSTSIFLDGAINRCHTCALFVRVGWRNSVCPTVTWIEEHLRMQNKVGFAVMPINPRKNLKKRVYECHLGMQFTVETSFYCLLICFLMNMSLSNSIPTPTFEILLSAKIV